MVLRSVFIFFHAHAVGILSGKENETKEKGAGNKAHFSIETRYPAAIYRLPTGPKCAALLLDVPLDAHLNFNDTIDSGSYSRIYVEYDPSRWGLQGRPSGRSW